MNDQTTETCLDCHGRGIGIVLSGDACPPWRGFTCVFTCVFCDGSGGVTAERAEKRRELEQADNHPIEEPS